jgi:hypothetical protein
MPELEKVGKALALEFLIICKKRPYISQFHTHNTNSNDLSRKY